jgi:hypothetical protein
MELGKLVLECTTSRSRGCAYLCRCFVTDCCVTKFQAGYGWSLPSTLLGITKWR